MIWETMFNNLITENKISIVPVPATIGIIEVQMIKFEYANKDDYATTEYVITHVSLALRIRQSLGFQFDLTRPTRRTAGWKTNLYRSYVTVRSFHYRGIWTIYTCITWLGILWSLYNLFGNFCGLGNGCTDLWLPQCISKCELTSLPFDATLITVNFSQIF